MLVIRGKGKGETVDNSILDDVTTKHYILQHAQSWKSTALYAPASVFG